MGWMIWTGSTAIFFIVIIVLLIGMGIWESRSPTVMRRGFLPIATTRGDRLFIGLLGIAFVMMGWLAVTTVAPGLGLVVAIAAVTPIWLWG